MRSSPLKYDGMKRIEMTTRRTFLVGVAAAGVLGMAGGLRAEDPAAAAAQAAAQQFLALTDAGQYAESWDQASSLFRKSVTKDQWVQAAAAARGPLGALVSRKVKTVQHTKTLPGVPDGDYVVIQFDTVFANKKVAVETVTPMLDAGQWRVSGYFVK